MTEHLLIEQSPFGCRGVVLDAEERPVRLLHRFTARREIYFGDLFWGRAGDVDKRLGLQTFDLGEGREGVLPVRDRTIPRGQLVRLGVRREPLGPKRAVLTDRPSLLLPAAAIRLAGDGEPGPGPLGEAPVPGQIEAVLNDVGTKPGPAAALPPVVAMAAALATGRTTTITLSSGALAAELAPFVPDGFDLGTDDRLGDLFTDPTASALERVVALEGGGRLVFDETEALTAVDVDLGATSGQSKVGAGESLRRRALDRLGMEISLRSIGGQVILDLPRSAVRAPKALRDQLAAALKPAGLASVPATTKDGLVILVFGQNRRPLLQHITVPVEADVRDGRAMAPDMEAWIAYGLAETAMASARGQQLRLALPAASLTAFVDADAPASLKARFGTELRVSQSADGSIDIGPAQ